MSKFWVVFKYEFMRQIKNKAFIVTTSIFLILSVIGGVFVSLEVDKIFSEEGITLPTNTNKMPLYVYSEELYKDYILQIEEASLYEIIFSDSEEELLSTVEKERSTGLIVKDYQNIEKITAGTSMITDIGMLENQLNVIYQNKLYEDAGLSKDEVNIIQNSKVMINVRNTGTDGIVGFGYTYAFSFLLYMTVSIFGGIISSSVVSEKTSKAMEMLITSADATSLIAGKVIAIGLSCMIQLTLIVSGFIIPVLISLSGTPIVDLIKSMGIIRMDLILWGLFLFIMGFFSILFLFAGLSSFATKPEDANIVITPLVLITLVVFMVNITAVSTDFINLPVMKVVSYIPIISPFLLFSRFALYGLSAFEIILGIIVNILGAGLLIWMAAKIYRSGTLHYGNTIKFRKIFQSFRK